MHPQNVAMVVECKKIMSLIISFLWSLSICKIRFDVLALQTKVAILAWWSFQMRMSLNWKEAVRR